MKTSAEGRKLITSFEGLELNAYPDPATGGDPWTIGYGHTGAEVKKGLKYTKEQAEAVLISDLMRFERAVEAAVTVELQQWQFDACVSLCFNIGPGNFKSSTLVKKINQGDAAGAADQFLRWDKAAGKVMAGLTRRRKAERAMFLGQPW